MKIVRRVRRERFDLIVSASPSVRHGLLVLLSGAGYKLGYLDYTRAKTVHLQPHRIRALGFRLSDGGSEPIVNITERVTRLCKSLGVGSAERAPVFSFLRGDSTQKAKISAALGLTGAAPYIIVHPLSGWSYKTWPLQKFQELIHRIFEAYPHQILIIGAESDRICLQSLVEGFAQHSRVLFAVGLPLDKLAAVIAGASLFIGGDSGPLHLAAAVGTPSVGLFGPGPPELTGPQAAENRYIYRKLDCSPCNQEECVRPWAPCMSLITVDEVFERVEQCRIARGKPSLGQVALLPNSPQAQSPST
jgi:ADP-heptose:LPS heptosyltransferase